MSVSDVNVLLLGESGVGKSTFINAFANYNRFGDFNLAITSSLVCLIPTKFTITDEDYNYKLVQLNEDGNENCEVGKSATQEPREYKFQVHDRTICLIDTPGVGDDRGLDQDEKNIRNIMNYIQKFKHLNAICFLLKPNESILTEYFRFCITQLFSCLPKTAAENIVFVFTTTRSTCYRPAETMPVLQILLDELRNSSQGVNISCNVKNVFCVDNEAFRYLVALKSGLTFTEKERADFSYSWKTSAECCQKMLQHIVTSLNPHELQQVSSMHEAKDMMELLCPILLEVYKMKEICNYKIQRYSQGEVLKEIGKDIKFLKQEVRFDKMRKKDLHDIPMVLCSHQNCCREDKDAVICKQICHMQCDCIRFEKSVKTCCVFDNGHCVICGCLPMNHEQYKKSKNVLRNTKESANDEEGKVVSRIRDYISTLETDFSQGIKALAKLSHFVNENSMGCNTISFKVFIEDAIMGEERLETERNPQLLTYYTQLHNLFESEKKILDEALLIAKTKEKTLSVSVVSNDDVINCMEQLRNLPLIGAVISQYESGEDVTTIITNILHPPIRSDKCGLFTSDDIQKLHKILNIRNMWKLLGSLTPDCSAIIRNISVLELVSYIKKDVFEEDSNVHNISNDLIILDTMLILEDTTSSTPDKSNSSVMRQVEEEVKTITTKIEYNIQDRIIVDETPASSFQEDFMFFQDIQDYSENSTNLEKSESVVKNNGEENTFLASKVDNQNIPSHKNICLSSDKIDTEYCTQQDKIPNLENIAELKKKRESHGNYTHIQAQYSTMLTTGIACGSRSDQQFSKYNNIPRIKCSNAIPAQKHRGIGNCLKPYKRKPIQEPTVEQGTDEHDTSKKKSNTDKILEFCRLKFT